MWWQCRRPARVGEEEEERRPAAEKNRTARSIAATTGRFCWRRGRGRRRGADGGPRPSRGGPGRRRFEGDGGGATSVFELGLGFRSERNGEEWDGEREREQVGFVAFLSTRRGQAARGARAAWARRHSDVPVATGRETMTFLQITPWLQFPFSNSKTSRALVK